MDQLLEDNSLIRMIVTSMQMTAVDQVFPEPLLQTLYASFIVLEEEGEGMSWGEVKQAMMDNGLISEQEGGKGKEYLFVGRNEVKEADDDEKSEVVDAVCGAVIEEPILVHQQAVWDKAMRFYEDDDDELEPEKMAIVGLWIVKHGLDADEDLDSIGEMLLRVKAFIDVMETIKDDGEAYARYLDLKATFNMKIGAFEEAAELLGKLLEIGRKIHGTEDHPDLEVIQERLDRKSE
eukprot:TRINITY_DN7678_c0_g1_i1.p1 TRINITY_DN7678_c0_g1~~TRINITY_DN7678_c0_g1_i1.p1  ORF type:complete len:242 (-),score=92.98 TRINITY_DN7678_c0_g1_i1:206-910(-)